MSDPTPTPTQAENDALKLGEMHPDEKDGGTAPTAAPAATTATRATPPPPPPPPKPPPPE